VNRRHRLRAVILGAAALVALSAGPARSERIVRSLIEQRQHLVVIQQWDLSCGAAALATILNFQHGDSISEREIALGMMSREEYLANPDLVSLRQGFSLLDMQRFVETRGYRGLGYGQLTLSTLIELAPAIVPISSNGYQHFVVFRGMQGDRVLLADPAFGNRSMPVARFESAWLNLTDLGRVGFVVERTDGLIPPDRLTAGIDE
jgi:predicted double-glycine peptidase